MTTTTVSPRSPDARALPPAPGGHPAVPAVPPGAVGLARAAMARAFFSRAAARVPIRIQAPDGRQSGAGGPSSPVLVIRDQDAFCRRLGSGTAASQLGFGPAFQRMWNLYLAYAEGGFRSGYLDVHQLVLERGW